MFGFLRTLKEKDINSTKLGKLRNYSLARGERTLSFRGRLLGFYHAEGDALEVSAQDKTLLETIAIFRTRTRYLIYYQIHHHNNEHLSGRQVHIHVTDDLDGAAAFIDAMVYPNKRAFADGVIEDARSTDALVKER